MMEKYSKIAVWGYGREGKAVYRFLKKHHPQQDITILLDEPLTDLDPELTVLYGPDSLNAISQRVFDLIFKSPGISLYREEIEQARSKGTEFLSATNLWFEQLKGHTKTIVITGTKGKSTTASLLYHVMKEAGLSVSLGGNIGKPLLDLPQGQDYAVLELSSYQLADLAHSPDIFAVLNLFPEHLEWHKTHENYYRDKLSPLFKGRDFTFFANGQNETLKDYALKADHNVLWFDQEDLPKDYSQSVLKGSHNLENIKAVFAMARRLGIDDLKIINALKNFQPLPHRLQEFRTQDGILCVNDSISTTPESTMAALNAYAGKPVLLILGGTDREQNYKALIEQLKKIDVRAVFLLPENGERIKEEMSQHNVQFPVRVCDDLEALVKQIKDCAKKDDIILLSPAAPSYGQFQNFEERGSLFMRLMQDQEHPETLPE